MGSMFEPLMHKPLPSTGAPPAWCIHVVLLLVHISFSGWHLVGKYVVSVAHVAPMIFALYREIGSSVLMFLLAAILEDLTVPRREHISRFLFYGFLYFTNVCGFIVGLSFTSATNAAMLQPLATVLTAAFASISGIERLTMLQSGGLLVATLGAILLAFASAGNVLNVQDRTNVFVGNLVLLVQVSSLAGGIVVQKELLIYYPPITVTAWGYSVGAVVTVLVDVFLYRNNPEVWMIQNHGAVALWSLAYAIVFATTFTYCLMTWANRHTQSSIVGAYQVLAPFFTVTFCTVILQQPVSLFQIVSGIVLLVGLFMSVARGSGKVSESLSAIPTETLQS